VETNMTEAAEKIALSPDASTEPQQHRPNGKFAPGHKKVGGRGHGSKNKFPKSVKSLVLEGIGDIARFVEQLKINNPSVAAMLLQKTFTPGDLIPERSAGKTGPNIINVISVPPDHSFCPDGHLRPNFEAKPLWEAHRAAEKAAREAYLEPIQIERTPHAELVFAGAAQSQPDPVERVPVERAPEPEPSITERAVALGFTLLPSRPRRVE
jgi:hypothetical protein